LSSDDSDEDAADTLLGGKEDDTIYAGGNDIVDGGAGDDDIILSSSATGVTQITYDSDDTITITLETGYDGEGALTLMQVDDDVQVLLDGTVVILLLNADADDVTNVAVEWVDG